MARSPLRLTQCWPTNDGHDEPPTATAWIPVLSIRYVQEVTINGKPYALIKLTPAGSLYVDYPAEKLCVLIEEYYDGQ